MENLNGQLNDDAAAAATITTTSGDAINRNCSGGGAPTTACDGDSDLEFDTKDNRYRMANDTSMNRLNRMAISDDDDYGEIAKDVLYNCLINFAIIHDIIEQFYCRYIPTGKINIKIGG